MRYFHEPEVIAACINALAIIIAAIVTAVTASMIGKKIRVRQELIDELAVAKQDIRFLLKVERRHCELQKEHNGNSNFLRVRQHIEHATGTRWSGRFTPGRQKQGAEK